MATYKYKLLDEPGSSCYVAFNSTPDIASGVAVGESIRIDAEYYQTFDITDGVGIYIWDGGTVVYSSNFLYIKRIPKSTKTTISFTFPMPDLSSSNGAVRAKKYTFSMFGWMLNHDSMVQYGVNPKAAEVNFLNYRLNPKILAMDFERATVDGKWADDGQYLQCKTLKIAKNSLAAVSDFTKATIVCTGSDGSSRSVNLTQAQLTAALTSGGYSETKPGVFAGFASGLGVTYTLTLTLGDAYDQTTFADTVVRSFARLHLSGAANGGVAVGTFSSATDDTPKFEVAEDHESHFYSEAKIGDDGKLRGGTEIVGINLYQNGERLTGGHWIDGKPIYRFVAILPKMTANTTVDIPSTIDVLVNYYGCAENSGGSLMPFSYSPVDSLKNGQTFYIAHKNSLRIIVPSGGIEKGVLVLEYTKSATSSPPIEGPEIFDDGPHPDEGVARADYIGMMAGIEIPEDVEANGAQADPSDVESPGIDGEPATSAHYETVERYYKYDCWSAAMVKNAVGKWITADETERILTTQKESE